MPLTRKSAPVPGSPSLHRQCEQAKYTFFAEQGIQYIIRTSLGFVVRLQLHNPGLSRRRGSQFEFMALEGSSAEWHHCGLLLDPGKH